MAGPRWAEGDLDSIVPVLPDLVGWLRSAGIDSAGVPDVVVLINDPSLRRIRSRVARVDWDPGLLDMFRRLASAIGN
jgi:hypothetical protein